MRPSGLLQRGGRRPLKQRLLAWATNTWLARQILAPQMVKQVARKARKEHYPAPFALISTWQRSGGLPIHAALKAEARSVVKLAQTPTARNLVRVFFLMDRLKGLGGKDHGISHVHVVGAGVMGGDIAAWCALRGFTVTLQDREMQFVQPAMDRAAKLFEKRVKDPGQAGRRPAPAWSPTSQAHGVAKADLIIEAIFENLDAKRALYAKLEESMKPDALLVSNTSSIPLTELRANLKKQSNFAGLHYFNPVALMPLVEIVKHDFMLPEMERRLAAFCRAIDKLPVPVAGTPGFLVNRILAPYMQEAILCFSEGIPGRGDRQGGAEVRHADGPDRTGRHGGTRRGRIGRKNHGRFPRPAAARRRSRSKPASAARRTDRASTSGRTTAPVKPEVPAGLPGTGRSGGSPDPVDAQRSRVLPARRRGRRCRPARRRRDLRHRLRALPRRPDGIHQVGRRRVDSRPSWNCSRRDTEPASRRVPVGTRCRSQSSQPCSFSRCPGLIM